MEPTESSTVAPVPPTRTRTRICDQLKTVSAPVFVAVMLFGMSTWLVINALWVEMPLLVNALPESWNLPSYLVIIIQCANLGPALYAMWDKISQRKLRSRYKNCQHCRHPFVDDEVVVSLIIIFTFIVSTTLLSIFWNYTYDNRSVALLTIVSFISLCSCTTSVVFLPYMARFPPVYISAYYFGMGLCSLVPGLLGLAQVGVQEPQCRNTTDINDTVTANTSDSAPAYSVYYNPPRISVSAYFALIVILLCISAAAFCSLNFVRKCRVFINRKMVEITVLDEATGDFESRENRDSGQVQSDYGAIETLAEVPQRSRYALLLVTIGIICALTDGILPATQTYTCLPYGNIVYRLAISLSWVVKPLATLPNMVAPTSSLSLIVGLAMTASLISAFHLVLAAQSPHPILQDTVIGQVIVVSTSVVMYSCFSFVRVSVSSVLLREGGRSLLLYCGVVNQLGSLCGAIITFILVAVLNVFQSLPPCSQ